MNTQPDRSLATADLDRLEDLFFERYCAMIRATQAAAAAVRRPAPAAGGRALLFRVGYVALLVLGVWLGAQLRRAFGPAPAPAAAEFSLPLVYHPGVPEERPPDRTDIPVDPMRHSLSGPLAALLLTAPAAPRTDPYGDPLPDGAVSRIGTTRMLHDDTLTWADFSADGKRLVTGGMYGERQVHVWDVATGQRVALLPTKAGNETWAVAASSDGKRAAAILSTPGKDAYRMWLKVWDVASGKKIAEVLTEERAGGHERVAFAPDGKSAAVRIGKIHLVDLEADRVTGTLDDPDDQLLELRYADGGRLLFVGGVRTFTIWDVKTRRRLEWENLDALGDTGNLSTRSLSADGRTMVLAGTEIVVARLKLPAAEGGRVRIESVKKFKTTDANKSPLAVAPDGARFAVADANGTTQLFALDKSEPVRQLKFIQRPVALHCGTDAALAAERGENTYSRKIHLWDLRTGKETSAALGLHYTDGPASWSAGGAEIITGKARWEPATGKYLGEATLTVRPAWKTPDGRLGLLSRDGSTALASVVDGPKVRSEPRGSIDLVIPLARTLEVWDALTYKRRTTFRDRVQHLPRIGELAAGPYRLGDDGRIFAAMDYTELQLWNTTSGRLLAAFDLQKMGLVPVCGLDLSADGRRLLVAPDTGAAVIDVAGRQVVFKTSRAPKNGSWATCRLSPDGRRVALAGGDSELLILDVPSGKVVAEHGTKQSAPAHVAFSPDGRRLLTQGGAGWCLVWDVPAAEPAKPLTNEEMAAAWARLAGDDVAAAIIATRRWSASGTAAVEFLGKKLRPETPVAPEEVRKLVAELGAPKFRDRETARKRLQEFGEPIVPGLRAELERAADPEVAERLRRIVDHPDKPLPPPTFEVVRGLRALEALEHIGAPAAREVIERMAKGAEGMPLAEEARAILRRLGK
jgi:WD40 repeat protein